MKLRWMPLDVADYRADTMHLDAFEHGVYLLLIMHYWQTGGLPDDDDKLARICCCTRAEFRRVRPVIEAFFREGWKHKRIEKELERAWKVNSAKQDRAREAANARWSKQAPSDAPSNAPSIASSNASGIAQAMLQHAPSQVPLPSPSPSQIKNLNPSGEGKRDAYSPPRHGLTSQRTGRIYVVKGTPEWDAYADDYRQTRGTEPNVNPHGGRWFKTLGEGS